MGVLARKSLYWCGYDNQLRPILWVHPGRKNWQNIDVEAEIKMHVLMIEAGLRMMTQNVCHFLLIADSSDMSLRNTNIKLFRELLGVITKGYPDRLGNLYVGPMNAVIKWIFKMLEPLMPRNLRAKIKLIKSKAEIRDIISSQQLSSIPTEVGGTGPSDAHDIILCDPITGLFSFEKMIQHQQEILSQLLNNGNDISHNDDNNYDSSSSSSSSSNSSIKIRFIYFL